MTVSVQRLTNGAYGFGAAKVRRVKPVALACIHITGNKNTASMVDLHGAAQGERNYANRAGSHGPSAHYYIARDGWAIEAVDPARFAAWSNGIVLRPHLSNPGVARAVAFKAKNLNVNEAYWLEFEAVGFGSAHPVVTVQVEFMAGRIAAFAKSSGLPINRETVHGHWEIDGLNRQNCPNPPSGHESFLNLVIHRANAILHPAPATYTLHIKHSAIVRVYPTGANGCLARPWVDEVWDGAASSASCTKAVSRKTCDGRSSATVTKVTTGKYKGKTIRVGYGVTVTTDG